MSTTKRNIALLLDSKDNVAILLNTVSSGDIVMLKGTDETIKTAEPIKTGHKAALIHIKSGSAIIKYGQQIGIATADINPGEWIHLHNMESAYDKEFKKRIEV